MRKALISIIVTALLVGGGAFYGGMRYGKSLSSEQRQQFLQGNVGGNFQVGTERGSTSGEYPRANFLSGEVISKDSQSLTLKMSDGGSKIVFFSDSTKVSKMADGSIEDIEIGKQIMITGQQNSDGSYTAQTIQLTPRSPGQ